MPRLLILLAVSLLGCATTPSPSPAPQEEAAKPAAPATHKVKATHAPAVVEFPAAPERQETTVESSIGPLTNESYMLESDDTAFGLNVMKFPESTFDATKTAVILESSRDGALQNTGATLIESKAITMAGPAGTEPLPGLEFYGRATSGKYSGAHLRARLVMYQNRLIMLTHISKSGAADAFNRFVQTLHFE
jgi:hypothetical protein